MLRVRPVEAGLSAFGPCAQMAPAWPKLRSRSSAAASWQRCAAECEGRAAPAERGTERFLQRQSALQGLCKGAAGPSGAAHHIQSTHPGSVCCLGSSRDPCAANQMAAVAQHLPPPRPRNKKSPRRGTNATSPRAFLVKAIAPPSQHLYYTTSPPAPSIPSIVPPEQRALPTGRAVGGALPRSLALHLGGVA